MVRARRWLENYTYFYILVRSKVARRPRHTSLGHITLLDSIEYRAIAMPLVVLRSQKHTSSPLKGTL